MVLMSRTSHLLSSLFTFAVKPRMQAEALEKHTEKPSLSFWARELGHSSPITVVSCLHANLKSGPRLGLGPVEKSLGRSFRTSERLPRCDPIFEHAGTHGRSCSRIGDLGGKGRKKIAAVPFYLRTFPPET
ncbi:hypothetical protein MRX96_035682 [Rhipicephalus microplus]